jgi:uncharacterized membrane protein HdeD (DUF308 family)
MTLIDAINKDAKAAKWAGILLLVAGFISLVSPLAAGLSITVIIGVMLLLGGLAQLLVVFRAGAFDAGLLMALLAILTLGAGGYMISQPVSALATLTLFLAGYFIALGVIEIIGAFGAKSVPGWGWLLFDGIVSLVLGVMIWRQFPISGVWAIGTLVGIRLIISGWTLITIGGFAKHVAKSAADS